MQIALKMKYSVYKWKKNPVDFHINVTPGSKQQN